MSVAAAPFRNALIAQCGGPTAVINRTLAATIEHWQQSFGVSGSHQLLGARNGLLGLANEDWVRVDGLDGEMLARLAQQPAMALGGGRYRLAEDEYSAVSELLRRREVDALFLIGGNGTAAAAHRLAQIDPALRVFAIPKTVDNDLFGTEVAPGYGSAARYTALSLRNVRLDLQAMTTFEDAVVYEAMGRHAGWLAAASALARTKTGEYGPHLILLPEIPHDEDDVLEEIARIHAREGVCLVVASEGIRDEDGVFWAEKEGAAGADASGQRVFSMAPGVSAYLAKRIQERLGFRCRQIRPNTMQRTSSATLSPLDCHLAEMVGRAALDVALEGGRDQLLGLARNDAGWMVEPVALAAIVGRERHFPSQWLQGVHDIADEFNNWAAPFVEPFALDPVVW